MKEKQVSNGGAKPRASEAGLHLSVFLGKEYLTYKNKLFINLYELTNSLLQHLDLDRNYNFVVIHSLLLDGGGIKSCVILDYLWSEVPTCCSPGCFVYFIP